MSKVKFIAITALLVGGLSGCMYNDVERAGIGAAAGVGTALITNGNIGTGILAGAAAGALCDDVNLC